MNRFLDCSVNLVVWDTLDFFRASVQEHFEFPSDRGPISRRRNLLRRKGDNADFLIGINRPAQEMLYGGFDVVW